MIPKRVGIRDVAQAAGVSVTTVSHVLNDTPNTRSSDETRARVKEVARVLGYGPNRLAQGLRTQRSGMIGLLSEEIATTPHAVRIILGAQEAARAHGLSLMILNSAQTADGASRREDVAALLERQVDGILLATILYHRELSLPPNLVGVPAVLIDAHDRAGRAPGVEPDEENGARTAVTALATAGHRRIGFLNYSGDIPATHGRLRGYRQALDDFGIPFDAALIVAADYEALPGYEVAYELLGRANRPTALFCFNDRMAMGAYRAASELGLSIPGDLSVIGFDNQELIAANLHPPLTTVALPHYEMGAWAVETLIRIMNGHEEDRLLADHPTLMDCPLVLRDSVAPPHS